jgi:hypothetical protein
MCNPASITMSRQLIKLLIATSTKRDWPNRFFFQNKINDDETLVLPVPIGVLNIEDASPIFIYRPHNCSAKAAAILNTD